MKSWTQKIVSAALVASLATLGALPLNAEEPYDNDYPWMDGDSFDGLMNVVSFARNRTFGVSDPDQRIDNIGDVDYYLMVCDDDGTGDGLGDQKVHSVGIEFSHAIGDLDIKAYTIGGRRLGISQSTTDNEKIDIPASDQRMAVVLEVYGWRDAVGSYDISLYCR